MGKKVKFAKALQNSQATKLKEKNHYYMTKEKNFNHKTKKIKHENQTN